MRRAMGGGAAWLLIALLVAGGERGTIGMQKYPQTASPMPCAFAKVHEAPVGQSAGSAGKSGSVEKYEFQAEVSRLLDIIINSLYSNKDIFMREVISNAADALDKTRYMQVASGNIGGTDNLDVRITLDKAHSTLHVRDTGVGMTKDDLVHNLGTIAKSGTSAFLDQVAQSGDISLIGQFGVGFYSVYLVADTVTVVTKHDDDKQWVWQSAADGSFVINEDTENEPLGRGTEVRMHLRNDSLEFNDEEKIKNLVQRYSQFINFPIYMWTTKTEEVDDDAAQAEEGASAEEGVEDVEDEDSAQTDSASSGKQPGKVTRDVSDWTLLNDVKALWLRPTSEPQLEEYQNFYKALTDDSSNPLTYTHFSAEGDVEFKSILFVPQEAPQSLFDNYASAQSALKLYVRRVFISDQFEDLLPKWLAFIKGVVDSDSLPLNVAREQLQQSGALKTIKKKLVRKALDMIKRLSDDARKEAESEEGGPTPHEESDEGSGATDVSQKSAAEKYKTFWEQFGKAIKLGIVEDSGNRNRLAKLLRFHTSEKPNELTSLDDYVARMKTDQKSIYYIAGIGEDELSNSPFLEKLTKRGYEVIYFTNALDEYVMQRLTEYEEYKFQDASKEDLKLDEREKERLKSLKDEFKPLTKWWKSLLPAEDVDSVRVSNRLVDTPCVVVTGRYGWSANMERVMMAQALADDSGQSQQSMRAKKTLEVNPRHPMIKELLRRVSEGQSDDEQTKTVARALFQTAVVESGFIVHDSKRFATDVHKVLSSSINVDPSQEVDEDTGLPPPPEDDGTNQEQSASYASTNDEAFGGSSSSFGIDEL